MASFRVFVFGILLFGGGIGIQHGSAADCDPISNGDALSQDHFVSELTDPCRYDKYVPPTAPVDVTVTMNIAYMQASQTQLTAHFNVECAYLDPNLNYATISPNRSTIIGDESLKEKIWTPNILMRDTDETTFIGTETKSVVVFVKNTGHVTYAYKMTLTFNCKMDLQKFPFDSQQCKLNFGDWSNSATNLNLQWQNTSSYENFHFSEFVMREADFGIDTTKYSPVDETFSTLTIDFKFHRDRGYYVLDFFVPSYLLVLTAWVTFWLQADAGPPRATLGASTIVAFITLHLGVSKDIPKVSYVKASDVWFLAITCFIFLSLAEFAFVNVIWRRRKQIELPKQKPKYVLKSAFMPKKAREDLERYASSLSVATIGQSNDSLNSSKPLHGSANGNFKSLDSLDGHTAIDVPSDEVQDFSWTKMTPQEVAIYVDRKARIVFPATFAVFNVLYWVYVFCL